MLTFDTNRLGNVLQRRFNAAWRETDSEPVWLLPQCAHELMGHRINPYALELGMKNVREELGALSNTLNRKRALWGESILWWAQELASSDLYQVRLLTSDEQEKVEAICENLDHFAFPKADPTQPLVERGDATLVAEAFATNTKILITSDENMRHGVIHQWALENAHRLEIDNPYVLFVQDAFFEENYVNRGDLDFLYKVALGAFWPHAEDASDAEVLAALNRSLKVMSEQQTGLQGVGRTIIQQWHNDVRKNDIIDHVREHLPCKMRASERRHPSFRGQRHETAS